jgi:hypothetical protein
MVSLRLGEARGGTNLIGWLPILDTFPTFDARLAL